MAIKGLKDLIKGTLENGLDNGICVDERMGFATRVERTKAFTQQRREEVGPGCGPLSQLITNLNKPCGAEE